ncbi:MAG: S8 family serine peptidase [Sedimentisphaerales bacterium]
MVRNTFSKAVLLSIVLIVTTLEAQPNPNPGPPNRYIVQVIEGADPGRIGRGVAQRARGKLAHVYTNAVKGFSVLVPPGQRKRDLENLPGVRLVEADVPVYAVGQTLPTGVDRIEADNSGVTDPVDVDIAIIDTGIDIDHPDLNVVGGRHFYSLWGLLAFEDDQYDDDNGHGSHCAGIAAAKDNDIGVVGMAPGARLWAVKVLDANGSGYLSDVIAGLDWVTAHAGTIEVANMSLAATASNSAFQTAVHNTVAAGVVCVVAAGNDTKDVYGFDGVFGTSDDVIPAAYPEAATISAMVDLDGKPGGTEEEITSQYGHDDSFANFSNDSHSVVADNPVTSPGKAIDLLMPGVNITSCYMNGGYAVGSGTSMASPHAAGLVALYIAGHGRANDASGVYAIRQALIDAGVAQDDPEGRGLYLQNDFDGNHENIGWAGSTESPVPSDTPPSVTITSPADGATVSGSSVAITAEASDDDAVDQVEFFVDGASIGVFTTTSYELTWDSASVGDGSHTITAEATDTIGQTASDTITVNVDNVDEPPSVAVRNPANGATVSETVTVTADAYDDKGVTQVEFFVGTTSLGADTNGADGWSATWDTTSYSDGTHTVSATATDTTGQTTTDSPGIQRLIPTARTR